MLSLALPAASLMIGPMNRWSMTAFVILGLLPAGRGQEVVQSPDGRIVAAAGLRDGRPCGHVSCSGRRIIENGTLGIEKAYDGDAFVMRAGDTLTILNSHENADVTELLEGKAGILGNPADPPRREV